MPTSEKPGKKRGWCGKYTIVGSCIIKKKMVLRHGILAGYIGLVSMQAVVQAVEEDEILRKGMETKNTKQEQQKMPVVLWQHDVY